MNDADGPLVAALVVLRSASGAAASGFAEITAANVAEFLPAPSDVQRAQSAFGSAGFKVGPAGGIAFSIEGTIGRFEQYFAVKLRIDEKGVWVLGTNGEWRRELPLAAVPDQVASTLVTIVFEPTATLDDLSDANSRASDD